MVKKARVFKKVIDDATENKDALGGENEKGADNVIKRRTLKGKIHRLSLRLMEDDWKVVHHLKVEKKKRSCESLIVDALNVLIEDEIRRNTKIATLLHEIH